VRHGLALGVCVVGAWACKRSPAAAPEDDGSVAAEAASNAELETPPPPAPVASAAPAPLPPPDPDEAEVKQIAARFRDSRYDIKVALHALLTSEGFYASQNRGVLVKSPVDLVVGTLRQFGLRPGEPVSRDPGTSVR